MKKLSTATVVMAIALTAAMTAFAQPGKKIDEMKILSFTGQVQIKMADGSVIGVVPGAPIPEIPAGAEIVVISGEAVFQAGNTVISANKGDSFTFAVSEGRIEVAATGTGSSIQVTVGKTEATVETGDKISVTGQGQGKGELKVMEGSVAVTSEGKTETLAVGQTSTVVLPPTAPVAPAPAPAPTTAPTTTTTEPTTEPTTTTEPAPEEILLPPPDTTVLPPPPNPAQETCTTVSPSAPGC
ncbi:MAG TPA: hypothetical protein DD417_00985 [Elusimicrobia bacterium]|nr:hypothetical protein [Elusimicrobiota bacterium]